MNATDKTTRALVALSYVEELSLKRRHAVLDSCGDPGSLDPRGKKTVSLLGDKCAEAFSKNLDACDAVFDRMRAEGVGWLTFSDDMYPERLRQIELFPQVLYVKGDVSLLSGDIIAVVGTRRPTRYGFKVADSFTREFARAGLTVVSGFARGIDKTAHKACVESGAPTIAVFACGLDVCYPAEHRGLYDAILDGGGLLVSEYPPGFKPLQFRFPERNRIISGLSRGVFLPEAALKSGSLITVNAAIEQGRDIFVVPGNINSPESEGCNHLLRQMPHALTICPEDVLSELGYRAEAGNKEEIRLDITQTVIVEALREGEKHFEELLELTGLSAGELSTVLVNLELMGVAEQTSGNFYGLC